MKPDEWLKSTQVVRVRNKLVSWSRDDVLRFAEAEFGTRELTKPQVAELAAKLKAPGVEKPGRLVALEAEGPKQQESVEFHFVPNPGHAHHKAPHWYLAGDYAAVRFSHPRQVTAWALRMLFEDATRARWGELVKAWNAGNRIDVFNENRVPGLRMKPDLERFIGRHRRKNQRQVTPLPDNSEIVKQYWALSDGDELLAPDGSHKLVVASVRANLDDPPTVTFRKEPLDGNQP